MINFGQRYVLDTNALIRVNRHRRASAFFQENVVIPDEVLHEAAGFPDIATLRKHLYPTTSRVLEWMIRVMATVPTDDKTLVDLYANLGGADPLVVACALDGQAEDSQYLAAPEWIVVTGDDAVRQEAEEFDLKVIPSAEFSSIIDATEGHRA